jgi:hypothetical protein
MDIFTVTKFGRVISETSSELPGLSKVTASISITFFREANWSIEVIQVIITKIHTEPNFLTSYL